MHADKISMVGIGKTTFLFVWVLSAIGRPRRWTNCEEGTCARPARRSSCCAGLWYRGHAQISLEKWIRYMG